jgi:hypothetical protein
VSDWLAPVLAALIAAGAVIITNLFNSRASTAQRREAQAERAMDHAHEMEKWRADQEAARRKWLLERRADAYVNVVEWIYRDPQDPRVGELRSIIDVPLRAYASASVMEAYEAWLAAPEEESGLADPQWLEVMRRIRQDLSSD